MLENKIKNELWKQYLFLVKIDSTMNKLTFESGITVKKLEEIHYNKEWTFQLAEIEKCKFIYNIFNIFFKYQRMTKFFF